MAYVTVPKDLKKVKNKVALNLTLRQIVCFAIAGVIGIPFYFLVRDKIGTSTTMIITVETIITIMKIIMATAKTITIIAMIIMVMKITIMIITVEITTIMEIMTTMNQIILLQ